MFNVFFIYLCELWFEIEVGGGGVAARRNEEKKRKNMMCVYKYIWDQHGCNTPSMKQARLKNIVYSVCVCVRVSHVMTKKKGGGGRKTLQLFGSLVQGPFPHYEAIAEGLQLPCFFACTHGK